MARAGRKPERISKEVRSRLTEVRDEAAKVSRDQVSSLTAEKEPLEVVAFTAGYEIGAAQLDEAIIEARRSNISWSAIAEAVGDVEPGANLRVKNRFHKRLGDRL